jgi:hypothetical protein
LELPVKVFNIDKKNDIEFIVTGANPYKIAGYKNEFHRRIRAATPGRIAFTFIEGFWVLCERFGSKSISIERAAGAKKGKRFMPVVLFDSMNERNAVSRFWKDSYPKSVKSAIEYADGILENRIPCFTKIIEFPDDEFWHLEFMTGKHAPLKFYKDIKPGDLKRVGDVKNILEVNRHNFLIILGKAYWATGDRRYFDKWKQLILSWIEDNPYNTGVNWESSLEIAIRAVNWIWSSYFFYRELENDTFMQGMIYKTLYWHACHISRHLSYYFSPNTHLTGEALGLLYLGKAFPQMKRSSNWVSRAEEIFETELRKQILPDGGYFERATYYHKYTIDFYLHYLVLSGGIEQVDEETALIIKKMITHLALISEPDGTVPLLGDSDGGRLLDLGGRKDNIKGACCAAALLLGDEELKSLCGEMMEEEALWLLGSRALEGFGNLNEKAPCHYHSLNRETGFFCFRQGVGEKNPYILSICGPHGWLVCGHAHSDLMSYNLFNNGMMVLADPGTFTYSPVDERRNLCRSSLVHNTISVNGISQSIPGDTFRWKKIANPEYVFSDSVEGFGYLEGGHGAYKEYGCNHKRAIMYFGEDLAVVVDMLGIDKSLDFLLYNLQFNEGQLEDQGGDVYSFKGDNGLGRTNLRFFSTATFTIDNGIGEIYPDYNEEIAAPRLQLRESDMLGSHTIITLIGLCGNSVKEFEFDGVSRITGEISSARCLLTVGDANVETEDDEKNSAGISVFFGRAEYAFFMLRNSRMVSSLDGGLRFETRARQEYCTALLKGKTLWIRTEKPHGAFRVTSDIEKVFVNGIPIGKGVNGDWITIDP